MNNKILSFILLFIGAVFSLRFSDDNARDIFLPQMGLLVVIVGIICFIYFQQKSEFKSCWYKPSNIFILGYIVVNFQYVIDLLVGYKTYSDFYMPFCINKATYVCVLGFLAFVIGYMLSKSNLPQKKKEESIILGFKLIVTLQLCFFIGWILTVNILALISGYSYFEDEGGTASANFESLFYCSSLAILATEVSNAKIKKIISLKSFVKNGSMLSWSLLIVYILIRLVSGDRGPALYTILAIFFAYIMSVKKVISIKKILIPALLFAIVLNVVGMARSMDLNKSFSERAISAFTDFTHSNEARFSDRTVSSVTEELAISSRCNQIAVELIDNSNHSLHYGKFLFYQIIQCIPFVPSFLQNNLKIKPDELSANILMTDVYYGQHDVAQIGTTVIADAYFDLGTWGVLLMLFFIGHVYRKIDYGVCISSSTGYITLIVVLLFASMSIYIPRSTFIIQLKQLIPTISIFYFNFLISHKKYAK